MGREGGLQAPFPKLPGVLFEGHEEGELPSSSLGGNGDGSSVPSPQLGLASFTPVPAKTWPWGRREGRWEASTDRGGSCRAAAHPSATSFLRF